jgi:hypothetical protein
VWFFRVRHSQIWLYVIFVTEYRWYLCPLQPLNTFICDFTIMSYLNWTMNYNVRSSTCINFVVMIVKSQINVFRGCNGHKYHLYSVNNRLCNQVILRGECPLVHIWHPSCIRMEYVCSHDNNVIRIHLQMMLIIQKTSLFWTRVIRIHGYNVKNKIILEEHSIYYSFRKSNI